MKVKEVVKNNFHDEIKTGKVLVDFNATWCGPCRMLAPIIDEFSTETDIQVLSVDIDKFPGLAEEFNVFSIPCLVIFENGKEIKRSVGLISLDQLKEFVGD